MSFDRLLEVRSVARARAVEDFEFFANYVLGLSVPKELCSTVQRAVEQGQDVVLTGVRNPKRLENALGAWLVVTGKKTLSQGEHLTVESETFSWLFAEQVAA